MTLPKPYIVLMFFTINGFIFSTWLGRSLSVSGTGRKMNRSILNVEKSII